MRVLCRVQLWQCIAWPSCAAKCTAAECCEIKCSVRVRSSVSASCAVLQACAHRICAVCCGVAYNVCMPDMDSNADNSPVTPVLPRYLRAWAHVEVCCVCVRVCVSTRRAYGCAVSRAVVAMHHVAKLRSKVHSSGVL